MEYKKIRVTIVSYPQYVEEMKLFGWELEKAIKDDKDDQYILLNFKRNPNMENYEKIKELEIEWFSIDYPKFWPIVLFCILGFVCITALLVICMVFEYNFNSAPWLYAILIPGIIFINIAFGWFIYRTFKIKKILDNGENIRNKIRQEVNKLKNNEDEKNKN